MIVTIVLQAIYVPADDLTDPAPATTFAHLDATTVLSRAIAELGIYPAVDPLDSTSRIMDPNIVGAEHYDVARGVQKILQVWDLIITCCGSFMLGLSAIVNIFDFAPVGLQIAAGYHRHPGYGRVVRGGQTHCGPCSQDSAFPVPALPGGRGVHWPLGQTGSPERNHQGLQEHPCR